MRTSLRCFARAPNRALRLASVLLPVLGVSCAQEHEYPARFSSPIEIKPSGDAGDAGVTITDQGPHRPTSIATDAAPVEASVDAGPRDAGPGEAGPRDAAPIDARIPDASPPDARPDADDPDAADADSGPDAAIPDWIAPEGEQLVDISLAVACNANTPAPPTSTCRAWPWHEPPCFRTPTECAALHESTYCVSIGSSGAAVFTGLDIGASCGAQYFEQYAVSATANSLAQLGADLYTIESGVTRHSLADGSFDVTARQANALFVQGDQIILHVMDGSLVRYPSWEDMKRNLNGQNLGVIVSHEVGAVFGANADTIAVSQRVGQVDLFESNGQFLSSIQLEGYSYDLDGPMAGLDIDDTASRAFVLTSNGISTHDLRSGKLLRRLYVPGMQGLQCSKGLPLGAVVPPIPSSPRPGYKYTDRDQGSILKSSNCGSPFNGPRFYGQSSGPELLMLGTYFAESNQVNDERTAPHILVLNAIQPASWNIKVSAGSALERIIVNGSAGQVTVQSTTPVPVEYYVGSNALGSYAGNWPTWEEAVLRETLERYTGRMMTEILGCYLATTYTIGNVAPLCPLP